MTEDAILDGADVLVGSQVTDKAWELHSEAIEKEKAWRSLREPKLSNISLSTLNQHIEALPD